MRSHITASERDRLPEKRCTQGLEHREHDEQREQTAAAQHRCGHEQIALEEATACQPKRCQHQQRRQRQEGAPTHARLARAQLAPALRHPFPGPATRANGKAADQQPQQTQPAAQQQHGALPAPAGMSDAAPATARPISPSHSQGRPNATACIRPLAACSDEKTWPTASRPLVSCCAYQGRAR